MTIDEVLAKLSPFLWRKCNADVGFGSDNLFLFDWRRADEETQEYFGDTMDGEQPEACDLEHVIPIAVAGSLVGFEVPDEEYKDGVFHWGQFSTLLFVNLAEASDGKAPVYSMEVDGNIIPDTYKRLAADVSDLDIKLGAAE